MFDALPISPQSANSILFNKPNKSPTYHSIPALHKYTRE